MSDVSLPYQCSKLVLKPIISIVVEGKNRDSNGIGGVWSLNYQLNI